MNSPPSRADWPEDLQREFEAAGFGGCGGSALVSETDRVRVWHLRLPAGTRSGFRAGEHMVGCVETIGKTDLTFTTVGFPDGPTPPLPVPDGVRRNLAA